MPEPYIIPPGHPDHRDTRPPQPTQLQRRRAFPAWLIQYANWLIYRAAQEHEVPVYEVCMGGRKRTAEVVAARDQVIGELIGSVVQHGGEFCAFAADVDTLPAYVPTVPADSLAGWQPISRPAIAALLGRLDQSSVTRALQRMRAKDHA